MKFDLKGRNCFWVYQNKTFDAEAHGGFLWSPKYAKDGKTNPGYEAMKEVRKGDIVFHSYMGKIVAIGKAKDCCYSARRPGIAFEEWDPDGWKVDVEYFYLPVPFDTADYRMDIYRIQPPNGPMRSDGVGKQQYLCNVNQAVFDYIIPKILHSLSSCNQDRLLTFIDDKILSVDPLDPPRIKEIPLSSIEDGCKVNAILVGTNKPATLIINIEKFPHQKAWIGKKVGDVLETNIATLSYHVVKIYRDIVSEIEEREKKEKALNEFLDQYEDFVFIRK